MYGRAVPRKYVTRTTVIIAIGVLAFGGVLAAILLSSHPDDGKPPNVEIEVRAKGRAQIRVSGRTLGRSPRMVVVPMSTAPLEVEADYGPGHVVSRSIVPDHSQVVDLTGH